MEEKERSQSEDQESVAPSRRDFLKNGVTVAGAGLAAAAGAGLTGADSAEAQQEATRPPPQMWHIFQTSPIPEADVAVRKSADFINAHLR